MNQNSNIFFFDGKNIDNHKNNNIKTYHYTSPAAMYSIFENKQIRFTDCQFMNDRSEYVYIKKVLLKAYEASIRKDWSEPAEFIDHLLSSPYELFAFTADKNNKEFGKGLKLTTYRYYLFCTSLKPDSHNMWSYFTENGNYTGYSLRINIESLINFFSLIPGITLVHGKVIYDEKRQIKQLKDKIDSLDDQYYENMEHGKDFKYGTEEYPFQDILAERYQIDLTDFILDRCLFYKSHAFESEAEYRFIVKVPTDYNGENFKLKHSIGKNGIIKPHRELTINPFIFIDQIRLSPMMEKEVAKAGLISLLGLSYKNQFDIQYSDIDVRF